MRAKHRSSPSQRPAFAQIDVVFDAISAYRQAKDAQMARHSLGYAVLIDEANVVFNAAFKNLKARLGISTLAVSPIVPTADSTAEPTTDITDLLVAEVRAVEAQLARFHRAA